MAINPSTQSCSFQPHVDAKHAARDVLNYNAARSFYKKAFVVSSPATHQGNLFCEFATFTLHIMNRTFFNTCICMCNITAQLLKSFLFLWYRKELVSSKNDRSNISLTRHGTCGAHVHIRQVDMITCKYANAPKVSCFCLFYPLWHPSKPAFVEFQEELKEQLCPLRLKPTFRWSCGNAGDKKGSGDATLQGFKSQIMDQEADVSLGALLLNLSDGTYGTYKTRPVGVHEAAANVFHLSLLSFSKQSKWWLYTWLANGNNRHRNRIKACYGI